MRRVWFYFYNIEFAADYGGVKTETDFEARRAEDEVNFE